LQIDAACPGAWPPARVPEPPPAASAQRSGPRAGTAMVALMSPTGHGAGATRRARPVNRGRARALLASGRHSAAQL